MALTPATRLKIPLFAHPPRAGLVLLFLLGLVTLWAVLLAVSQQAPDLDSMEELVWSASLELGYTKHPPLPAWIMVAATSIFGRALWLPVPLGMLCSALGLWFLWKLGCELTSRHKALMAVLLVSVTAYFSLRASIFNHNTAQLWSITASVWLFYRAMRDGRMRDWVWLGIVCGLAMLTKYSALIQFFAFALYALRIGALRHGAVWRGILVAMLAFLVVFSPHLWWLHQHHYEPLFYADASLQTSGRLHALIDLLKFLVDQVARLVPLALVLAAWALWRRRRHDRAPGYAANDACFDDAQDAPRYVLSFTPGDRQFLLWVGLAPFITTALLSAVLGTRLEASWASTFFILAGFYGLWALRGAEGVQLQRLFVLVIGLQLVMAVGYALARGPLAHWAGYPARPAYPGPQLARLAQAHWQAHQPGRPLRVVAANTWLGGNIALNVGPHARVYIDASDEKSPWFAPGTALQCGALVAYSEEGRGKPAPAVSALYETAPWKGVDHVRWSGPKGPLIDLHWAVLPAGPDCLKRQGVLPK